MIYEEYHVKQINELSPLLNYFLQKEYGIVLCDLDKSYWKKYENYSLDLHEENTIYRAIMDKDLKTFIGITETGDFKKNQKFGSDFYPSEKTGYSLLELCCYHGASNCFKYLISEFYSEITPTCLELSFLRGNSEIFSECLKYHEPGCLCMKYAIIFHNIDFVTYLKNECNLQIIFQYCIEFNNLQGFLVYLDQTNNFEYCLPTASSFNLPLIVEFLIYQGANMIDLNFLKKILLFSLEGNYDEVSKKLILCGVDINLNGISKFSALHIAVLNNNIELVKFIAAQCADINHRDSFGQTALYIAAKKNYPAIAKILLLNGGDVNGVGINGENVLHIAVRNNNIDLVKLIVTNGVNVNHADYSGETAFDIAIKNDFKSLIKVLLLNEVDVNRTGKNGETALDFAIKKNNKDLAEILLSNGADINHVGKNGETVLHIAVLNNYIELAKLIIMNGADINHADYFGETVLHIAVLNNSIDLVNLIVSNGADINRADNSGETALELATKRNYKKIVDILLSKGHNIDNMNSKYEKLFRYCDQNRNETPDNENYSDMNEQCSNDVDLTNPNAEMGTYERTLTDHVVDNETNEKDLILSTIKKDLINYAISIDKIHTKHAIEIQKDSTNHTTKIDSKESDLNHHESIINMNSQNLIRTVIEKETNENDLIDHENTDNNYVNIYKIAFTLVFLYILWKQILNMF
ncbi:hypothetical protein TVAG_015820 [Trichomonas vaginalis G3]|uniref:DUF3447 domain-containing protein n=1 Tax=Trichomonas vaginalis (strain ATCC PRA-98 / G3) TaxID=412133 RepID=A2DP53_TRIV3|nr:protein ubiquitination [Trichomonas vaginalis G3]EAY17753.1 hypothetical protein TVAG_015820 [Trichomonas vaginalis G3]KAI5484232.1 protein ubiquitination [Trichomonas vaginalis G3]|eukprot:XP_001329888.1 hypothetical protein [Trichomonas vaginalis G3]